LHLAFNGRIYRSRFLQQVAVLVFAAVSLASTWLEHHKRQAFSKLHHDDDGDTMALSPLQSFQNRQQATQVNG
jgi:hypothetical protein